MYNLIFESSVTLSTIRQAIELVQVPGFQNLPSAIADFYAFVEDMERDKLSSY